VNPDNTKIIVENSYTDAKTGKFVPGNPGGGRPPGTYSLKSKIIKLLKENPEIEEKLIADLLVKEQGLLIQMIDGRPKQDLDVLQREAPQPIISLGNVSESASLPSKDVPLLE
jgi:hypothetical protein